MEPPEHRCFVSNSISTPRVAAKAATPGRSWAARCGVRRRASRISCPRRVAYKFCLAITSGGGALARRKWDPAMISLTDSQLQQILELAAPIPIAQRDSFLRELALELRLRGDVGPGELHHLCLEVRYRIAPWATELAAGIR
jgi:hypothetical protein